MATHPKPSGNEEDNTFSQKPQGIGNAARAAFIGGSALIGMGATVPTAQAQNLWQQMLPGALQELQNVLRQPSPPPAYYPQQNGYGQRPARPRIVHHAEIQKRHVRHVIKAHAPVEGNAVAPAPKNIEVYYPDLNSPNLAVTFQRMGETQPTAITVAQGTQDTPPRILSNGKVIKNLDPKDFPGVVLLQGPVLMPNEPFDLGKPPEVKLGDPVYVVIMGDPGKNSCQSQTDAKKTMVIGFSGGTPDFSIPFDVCVPGTPQVGIRSDGKVVVPTDNYANGKTKVAVYGGGDDYSEKVIFRQEPGRSASR